MDEATGTSPGLTLQDLRNTTELLERQAVAGGQLTETALDDRRPGTGADYPEISVHSWFAYALWLAERLGAPRLDQADRPLARVLHDALADAPARFALTHGHRMEVHPKSLDTLDLLDALDAELQQVLQEMRATAAAVANDELSPTDGAAVHLLGTLLKARSVRLYAWILSHPGPGVPFAADDADPRPPEWTADLTAADLEAIVRAHFQVNRADLDFLARAFPGDSAPGTSRLPLSGFVGSYANEMGVPTRELMCNVAVRSLFAGALVRAQSTREAMASSKAGAR